MAIVFGAFVYLLCAHGKSAFLQFASGDVFFCRTGALCVPERHVRFLSPPRRVLVLPWLLVLRACFLSAPVVLSCLLLCAGNVAYMVFQDKWSFPRTFCDYQDYQRNVPFFFPTCQSVRNALSLPSVKGGRA